MLKEERFQKLLSILEENEYETGIAKYSSLDESEE